MTARPLPEIDKLRARLDYDYATGDISRKARPRTDFTADRHFMTWNTRFCGKLATCAFKDGYLSVQIDSQNWLAHRVAFAIFHGRWPVGQIDHINGCRSDNRIENLREVDNSTNSRNTGVRKNNKTGVMGVKYEPRNTNKPWIACIKVDGVGIYLGSYTTKEEAVSIRKSAEIQYGYHVNHGERKAIQRGAR